MTDYELVSVFQENLNLIFTILMSYVSIVSAFLVVGYLVAAKLKPSMVGIITGLFTLISFTMIFVMNRVAQTFVAVGNEMRKVTNDGASSLGWHNITHEAEFLSGGIMFAFTSILILTYFGALIFFFHQRREGLSAMR